MKGEIHLEGEQNHLQRIPNEEESDRDEAASLLSEAPQNQHAGDAKKKEVRLHGTWLGKEKDKNEISWDGEELQRQKQNQTEGRRDISHEYSKSVSEEEMERTPTRGISVLQRSDFQQNIPLKKRPVSCPTCHAEVKVCHCLEHEENSRWTPEGPGFPIEEKPDRCFRSQNSFSVDFALNVPQPMYFEEKACQRTECGISFKESSALNGHQNHMGENLCKYKEFRQGFRQNSHLQINQRIHTGGKPFEYKECEKKFSDLSVLKIHLPSYSGQKPNLCEEWGESFSQNDELRVHHRVHTGENPFQCKEWQKNFTHHSHLVAQQHSHSGQKPDTGKECLCDSCAFKVHPHSHTEEKSYPCEDYGKNFCNSNDLRVEQQIHTGGKSYKCQECGKCFRQVSPFKIHQCFDSGEKPFGCEECGKGFTRRCNLAIHQQTHSGGKLCSCKICGKSFSDPSSLKIHKCFCSREKPYHCKEWGESCNRGDLGVHKGEKPYTCNECGKRFGFLSTFKIHQRYHAKDKTYACEECGKKLTRRCNLAVHQQIHAGEKPYAYKECGNNFRQHSDPEEKARPPRKKEDAFVEAKTLGNANKFI